MENGLKFRLIAQRITDLRTFKIVHTMEELQQAPIERLMAYQFGADHVLIAQNLYSGVHDCLNTPIFEGDVIRCRESSYSKETYYAVVRYGQYNQDGSGGEYNPVPCIGFYSDAINPDQLDDDGYRKIYEYDVTTSLFFFHSIEVVGNIYENPELVGGDIRWMRKKK